MGAPTAALPPAPAPPGPHALFPHSIEALSALSGKRVMFAQFTAKLNVVVYSSQLSDFVCCLQHPCTGSEQPHRQVGRLSRLCRSLSIGQVKGDLGCRACRLLIMTTAIVICIHLACHILL